MALKVGSLTPRFINIYPRLFFLEKEPGFGKVESATVRQQGKANGPKKRLLLVKSWENRGEGVTTLEQAVNVTSFPENNILLKEK